MILEWFKRILASQAPTDSVLVRMTDGDTHCLRAKPDESLLELCLRHKIEISHSCGGMGSCGTCRIEVEWPTDQESQRNEVEEEFARERGFGPHERLACQTPARNGWRIRTP